jgi:hypothetical protein
MMNVFKTGKALRAVMPAGTAFIALMALLVPAGHAAALAAPADAQVVSLRRVNGLDSFAFVSRYSKQYSLDERIPNAIILVFKENPGLLSGGAGAMGIIPVYAGQIPGAGDLRDLRTNIRAGCSLLNYLYSSAVAQAVLPPAGLAALTDAQWKPILAAYAQGPEGFVKPDTRSLRFVDAVLNIKRSFSPTGGGIRSVAVAGAPVPKDTLKQQPDPGVLFDNAAAGLPRLDIKIPEPGDAPGLRPAKPERPLIEAVRAAVPGGAPAIKAALAEKKRVPPPVLETVKEPADAPARTVWDKTKDAGTLGLQVLGQATNAVFSPFQSTLYRMYSDLMISESAVMGLFGLKYQSAECRMNAYYSDRQSTWAQWQRSLTGADTEAHMIAAYKRIMSKMDAGSVKMIEELLDARIALYRERDVKKETIFSEKEASVEKQRAYAAEMTFGLGNYAGQRMEEGRRELARGNKLAAGADYLLAGSAIGMETTIVGMGFGAVAQPIKLAAAGARYNLTSGQLSAALVKSRQIAQNVPGVALSQAEKSAIGFYNAVNKVETTAFLAPAGISGLQDAAGLYKARKAGDVEASWTHFNGLYSNAAGFMGMGTGLTLPRRLVNKAIERFGTANNIRADYSNITIDKRFSPYARGQKSQMRGKAYANGDVSDSIREFVKTQSPGTHAKSVGSFPLPSITFTRAETGVSLEALTQTRAIIDTVNALILPLPLKNITLTVKIHVTANGAAFTPGMSVLRTGMHFRHFDPATGKSKSKSISESLPATAHEYGHYIFDAYMQKNNPMWGELACKYAAMSQKRTEVSSAIKKYSNQRYKLEEQIRNTHDNALRQKLLKQREALIAELNNHMDALADISSQITKMKIFMVSTPYNELFADTVAALAFRDGRTITKLLSFSKSYSNRDFTKNISAEGWKDSEDHRLLDPVRSFIWKHYISNHIQDSSFVDFTQLMLQTIHDEINTRLSTPALYNLTPEKINKRLIQSLNSRL